MKTNRKFLQITFYFILGITVFLLIHRYFEFHFYYVEQVQLFLYDKTFISNLFFSFAGVTEIFGRWLLQFYIHPMIGSLITTILLLSIAILLNRISKKINNNASFILFPVLAVVFIFFMHLDHNYYIAGTIAFIFTLVTFLAYLYIESTLVKTIVASFSTALLFWWAGSVAFLYAVAVILWQLLAARKCVLYSLSPFLIVVILGYISIKTAWIGNYKQIFSPMMYFHSMLTPPTIIYLPWVVFLLLVVSSFNVKDKRKSGVFRYFIPIVKTVIVIAIIYYLLPIYGNLSSKQYKKLDYYARMNRWDDIIEESRKPINNLLYAYYLNIALMETNQLGKQFLQFDQKGINGLVPIWDTGIPSLIVLNELNFTLGDIAASQYFAFGGNIAISDTGSPRLYKRLVQTNLINGEYPVAEKYIKLLEKTHYYKKWAREQRCFLYDDKAVEDNPLLGEKRRGRPVENYLILNTDLITKLLLLAEANPANTTVLEYLASIFLFAKETDSFMELIDKYYFTGGSLLSLPEKYQEAIVVINENDPAKWEEYGINPLVVERFINYKQMLLKNKNNPDIAKMLYENFGNTFWSYLIFS